MGKEAENVLKTITFLFWTTKWPRYSNDKIWRSFLVQEEHHAWKGRIGPKINVIMRLEFELAYYDVPVQHVCHCARKTRLNSYLRAQHPGECVTTFVKVLYELADGCNFANKNEEIKDFLIGFQDKGLSERLQIISDLKLNKASEMATSYKKNQIANGGKANKKYPNEGRNFNYTLRLKTEEKISSRSAEGRFRSLSYEGKFHIWKKLSYLRYMH